MSVICISGSSGSSSTHSIILYGIIGAVVLISFCIVLFLILFYRNKQKQSKNKEDYMTKEMELTKKEMELTKQKMELTEKKMDIMKQEMNQINNVINSINSNNTNGNQQQDPTVENFKQRKSLEKKKRVFDTYGIFHNFVFCKCFVCIN